MKKNFIVSLVLTFIFVGSNLVAQNKEFKAAKALEAQYDILKELQVRFVDTVDVEKLTNIGIAAMLRSLDPYTMYIAEENDEDLEIMRTASYGGIGSLIRKIDSLGVQISQPYFGSPAVSAGLEPGDIILAINGEDVKHLTADECSSKMKGQPGTDVTFLVKKGRTGKVEKFKITRERVHISDVSYDNILKNDIGYIKLESFTEGGSNDVKKAVLSLKERGMKKLILDLRGNGGGLLSEAVNIVSLFVPKGTEVVSAKGRTPSSSFKLFTTVDPIDTLMPIYVLVNSGSASSSEIVAGALQDLDRALIMGTKTFGKGLVQSISPIGYNGNLKLTTAKYYTPSGRCVQAIDYSNRNSDGSVGAIADSLKKAFKTKKGRIVYDGGGITPDSLIKAEVYSRPAISLAYNGIIEDYAINFYKKNPSIASAKDFKLTDEQYKDFVKYASKRDFDSRSSASALLDEILKAAKDEDLYDMFKLEFDALEKKLNVSKEKMLEIKRSEIQPIVECEIANKYYFTKGRIASLLRTDSQLEKVLEILDKQ